MGTGNRPGVPLVRKGQAQDMHTREAFRERFLARFHDPAYQAERDALDRIEAIAWEAYHEERKSPVRRPAGPDFQEPGYELAVEWLETRDRLRAAQAQWADPATPSRVLVICCAPRSARRRWSSRAGRTPSTWRAARMAWSCTATWPASKARAARSATGWTGWG